MHGIRGGYKGSGPLTLLENHKAMGILYFTGQDSMENHKATKLAFIVGPIICVSLAGRW